MEALLARFWKSRSRWGSIAMAGLLCLHLAGCGGAENGSAPVVPSAGTVTGQVVSLATSTPVSGATVKTDTGTTTTATDGKFNVPAPAGDRIIVHIEATGFAEAFPVARVTSGQTTNLGVKLIPIGATASVSVTTGGTVSVPQSPARVTIPSNGLVPKAGGTPAGTVNVSLTPINPAADTNLMPGGFNGISAGGATAQPIESFGAMLVDIRDNAGARYTLAGGKTSTIRIPVGTNSANPPASVPLWFFDETEGVWKEEGTATLQGTAPNRYYEGTVAHFSYWNADMITERIFVTGCVRDANGQSVSNAIARTEGIDYTGEAIDFTATDGMFQVAMRKNSRAKLGLFEFDQTFNFVPISNTVNVGQSATDITLPNCLVKQPGQLTVTTAVLPGGNVGAAYNQTVAASGGVPGYVWSLNTGSNPLPAGLALNPSGVISGTPTAAGTTTITVKVTDSAGGTATKELALTITAPGVQPLVITTTALPAGTVGTAYNATVVATGGTGAKLWSVSSGTLPAGLTLNASTGVISGTPTAAGPTTFTVRVQDSGTPQQSAERPLTIVIIPSGGGGGGGGGGSLTVSNAPASVGGTFVPNAGVFGTRDDRGLGLGIVTAGEAQPTRAEGLAIDFEYSTGVLAAVPGVLFVTQESPTSGDGNGWGCSGSYIGPGLPGLPGTCTGVTVNRVGGTITFSNTVLTDPDGSLPPITMNGTLTFTPF